MPGPTDAAAAPAPSTLRAQLASGIAGSLGLRVLSLAATFLTTLVLARALGEGGYGVFAWASAWALVLQMVAVAGFDRLAVREVAAGLATGDLPRVKGIVGAGQRAIILSSLALTAGGLVLALATTSGDRRTALVLALLVVPLMALATLRQGATQGFGHVVAGRVPEDATRPLLLLGGVAALWIAVPSEMTSATAVVVQGLAITVAFLQGTLVLRRVRPAGYDTAPAGASALAWAREALPLGLVVSAEVLLLQLGVLMLGALSTEVELGVYAVATRIAMLTAVPEFAVNAAFLPIVARLHAVDTRERLRTVSNGVSAAGLLLALLAALPLLAFPSELLGLFSVQHASADALVRVLALCWVVSAVGGPNSALLVMSGHLRPVLAGAALALLVHLVAGAVLMPADGALGAAWTWAITLVVWNIALAAAVRRALGFWCTPLAGMPALLSAARTARAARRAR